MCSFPFYLTFYHQQLLHSSQEVCQYQVLQLMELYRMDKAIPHQGTKKLQGWDCPFPLPRLGVFRFYFNFPSLVCLQDLPGGARGIWKIMPVFFGTSVLYHGSTALCCSSFHDLCVSKTLEGARISLLLLYL